MMGDVVEEIPDLVEPITSWRKWRISVDGELLPINSSFGRGWPIVGTFKAECKLMYNHSTVDGVDQYESRACKVIPSPGKLTDDLSNHVGFGCGIYAYKTPETLALDTRLLNGTVPTHYVFGQIYQWGRCYEHTMGWRSEFASIKALYFTDVLSPVLCRMFKDQCESNEVPWEKYPVPLEPNMWKGPEFTGTTTSAHIQRLIAMTQRRADENAEREHRRLNSNAMGIINMSRGKGDFK